MLVIQTQKENVNELWIGEVKSIFFFDNLFEECKIQIQEQKMEEEIFWKRKGKPRRISQKKKVFEIFDEVEQDGTDNSTFLRWIIDMNDK